MATVAIGDIHGNLLALENLLDKVLPDLDKTDTLVFLGDYIDRGPETKRCVDLITSLRLNSEFSVVTMMGNHEEWLLATMHDYTRHSWLIGAESFDTIASYSPRAATQLRREAEEALIGFSSVQLESRPMALRQRLRISSASSVSGQEASQSISERSRSAGNRIRIA